MEELIDRYFPMCVMCKDNQGVLFFNKPNRHKRWYCLDCSILVMKEIKQEKEKSKCLSQKINIL